MDDATDPISWKSKLLYFPCHSVVDGKCTCGRPDCDKPGKHPRNKGWQEQATSNVAQVEIWRSDPKVNLGIACGDGSEVLVLDIDVRGEDGRATLHQLEQEHEPLPTTYTVRTPSQGSHKYFKNPSVFVKNAVKFAPGLDIRTEGGLVIVAGGRGTDGNYECVIDAVELPEVPQWLLDVILAGPKPAGSHSSSSHAKVPSAGIPSGSRNATLFRLASKLRGQDGLSQQAITDALLAENKESCKPPLTDDEVRTIAGQGSRYEAGNLQDPEHLSDDGNAKRLASRFGQDLRYSFEARKWYVWNGRRWEVDALGEVIRRAKTVVRDLTTEGMSLTDERDRKAFLSHALRSESSRAIDAMVKMAQSEEPIPVRLEDFDRDIWTFNLENGTLDLKTGELRPHRREDLLTKLSPVTFDPEAKCDEFMTFLKKITCGDESLQLFIQEAVGLTLTGDTSENCFFLLYGTGANGKTTLLELLFFMWGDYAQSAEFESFMKAGRGRVRNDIARMRGARLVKSIETEEGEQMSEAIVKQLTGNETISARALFQESFDFKPHFKLWLATNHKPKIQGTDDGIWRRIRLIPFEYQVPESEKNIHYIDLLNVEASGIFNWALAGLQRWLERGRLKEPDAVLKATSAYRDSQDIVKQFVEECCVVVPLAFCSPEDIRVAFDIWRRSSEGAKDFKGHLKGKLEALGFVQKPSNGHKRWLGIGLKSRSTDTGGFGNES